MITQELSSNPIHKSGLKLNADGVVMHIHQDSPLAVHIVLGDMVVSINDTKLSGGEYSGALEVNNAVEYVRRGSAYRVSSISPIIDNVYFTYSLTKM